jgi:hypothetical protein
VLRSEEGRVPNGGGEGAGGRGGSSAISMDLPCPERPSSSSFAFFKSRVESHFDDDDVRAFWVDPFEGGAF